jgi:signal transduction histidine kinase
MLAAGVAHEIRNPLTAIKARLFSLKRRLTPASQDRADTDVIDNEINRLERIVKDFLLFARPSDPQTVLMRGTDPLHEVQHLLGPQLERRGITVVVQESPTGWIQVDPHQIKQVLINLVQNAADATEKGGRILLRARCEVARLGDHTAEVVVLEVEDDGRGMLPEVQARLFDPFFSTKDGGTGLGLSIASRIVEKHGGALQYQTKIDSGTTFGVVLPRAREDASPSSSESAPVR